MSCSSCGKKVQVTKNYGAKKVTIVTNTIKPKNITFIKKNG
jgi:hypothetical protein